MSNFRIEASAQGAIPVTPSNTTNINLPTGLNFTMGLYVGGSGDLSVLMSDGTTATFTAVSAGVVLPLSVKRVNATGTTATGIVAVY